MIKGTTEELNDLVKTHICPEHPDKALTVTWLKDEGYVIRCGGDHYPPEITRQPTLTEAYKQGGSVPLVVENKIKARVAKKQPSGQPDEIAKMLGMTPGYDLDTGEALTGYQLEMLLSYARRYDLDPYRGHVVLMHGKPYATLDAYLYHANQTNISYTMRSHPLDENDRKLYRIDENDHAWTTTVTKINTGEEHTGLGVVTREEMVAMSTKHPEHKRSPVVAAHPWQLAQKRAEWQAMRRAFPIGAEDKDEE